jgi:hypothetical protein
MLIYCIANVDLEEIQSGDCDYSDFLFSTDFEYLKEKLTNSGDSGEKVYLYEMFFRCAENIIVLLLQDDFTWEDFSDFFDFALVEELVIE